MGDPNNNNATQFHHQHNHHHHQQHHHHHHHHQHHHHHLNQPHHNIDTLELDPADGLPYIDELRERLEELLLPCQTVDDVEERVKKLHPQSKLIELALSKANLSRSESHKNHKTRHHSSSSGASFAGTLQNITSVIAKAGNLVRDGVVGNKADNEFTKFKSAFIEFIIDDVLNLAGDFVKRQKGNFIITRSDIRTAMHADKDLLDMFLSDDKSSIMENHPVLAHVYQNDKYSQRHVLKVSNMTYKEKVRSMVDSENTFIRGLKLIIKVFKVQLEKLPGKKNEIDIIFCNIEDLLELSNLLLAAFEDALELVGQEDETPFIGNEILDLAQAEEFDAYYVFACRRMSHREKPTWKEAFHRIISDPETMSTIATSGLHFDEAVKYLLPNYLLNTIIQFFNYFRSFSELYELSKKVGSNATESDGNKTDYGSNPAKSDEEALKNTLSILIKTKRQIESLLETELDQKEMEHSELDTKKAEAIRAILERRLEAALQHERNLPLEFMPPVELYRFSEPDSKDNIQFENLDNRINSLNHSQQRNDSTSDPTPVIKCATLTKLVERLTYHKYHPNFVDAFLTTYKSFMSDSEELLDMLIERFKIPDPPIVVLYGNQTSISEIDYINYRKYLRRFRQEYSKPVKMRVVNVLKSWIRDHYNDFENHPNLLDKLNIFLDDVYTNEKILRPLIASIKKSIEQKKMSQGDKKDNIHRHQKAPEIEWWSAKPNEFENFDILTIHPVEFARQLTLIEFDIFQAIKPYDLINENLDLRTRKETKNKATNISKMERHFTLLSYWVRKCIVETEDFDKRCAIFNRTVDIMGVLRDLNNFNGLLAFGCAIESAPIIRLDHTRKNAYMSNKMKRVLDDYRELNLDHQRKLQDQLHSCNPPCLPYIGYYQTKLIHAKEGNKTYIEDSNFGDASSSNLSSQTTTTSPTLSNDEFLSSFSNSPVTPISPLPIRTPNSLLPNSATSMKQNQFFGGSVTLPRPISNNSNICFSPTISNTASGFNTLNYNNNGNAMNFSGSVGSNNSMNHSTNTLIHLQQQPLPITPSTPGPPKMINFAKQRLRAKLVAEIGRYQNTRYCFNVQPQIREYIESIESQITKFASSLTTSKSDNVIIPDKDMENLSIKEITKRLDDYLYLQSHRIEPKNSTKPPRSKSKLPEHWKSPGIYVNNCATPK